MTKRSFDGGPVGYKRPPVENQFKKGQKVPGSGRRKDIKNYDTIFEELLAGKVTVTENGKRSRISSKEALILRAFAKAMAGNVNDILRFVRLMEKLAPSKIVPEQAVLLIRTIEGDEDE